MIDYFYNLTCFVVNYFLSVRIANVNAAGIDFSLFHITRQCFLHIGYAIVIVVCGKYHQGSSTGQFAYLFAIRLVKHLGIFKQNADADHVVCQIINAE